MKRKSFFSVACLMICALSVLSCGKSLDLDKVDSGAVISLNDDCQVVATSIGSYNISYNTVGLPTKVGKDFIDYDEMTLSIDGEEYDFTMDNKGRITSVSGTGNDNKESSTLSIKFSYDGAGHLVSITGKGKATWDEDGLKVNETTEMKSTITWKKNLITKVTTVYEEQSKYDGKTQKSKETETFTPAYEEFNPMLQYTMGLESMIDVFKNGFALVGLLGKAPSALPAEIHRKYVDEGVEEKEYKYNYSYRFNDDGSINTESRMLNNYQWSYASFRYSYKNYISTKAEALSAGEEPQSQGSLYMRVFHPNRLDK